MNIILFALHLFQEYADKISFELQLLGTSIPHIMLCFHPFLQMLSKQLSSNIYSMRFALFTLYCNSELSNQ